MIKIPKGNNKILIDNLIRGKITKEPMFGQIYHLAIENENHLHEISGFYSWDNTLYFHEIVLPIGKMQIPGMDWYIYQCLYKETVTSVLKANNNNIVFIEAPLFILEQ